MSKTKNKKNLEKGFSDNLKNKVSNNSKRWIYAFILILLISLFLKSFALDNGLYDDESNYAFAATNAYGIGFSPAHYSGLAAQWFYSPLIKIFGVHIFLLRLIPLLFSTATIILVFLLTKYLYSNKAAFFAGLIMVSTFWHNLASIQIDIEGSILTFFYLLAISLYILINQKKNKPIKSIVTQKRLFVLLLALVLAIIPLIKNIGIFIFPILVISSLIETKSIKQMFKNLFLPFLISSIIFASINLLIFLIEPSYLGSMFSHGSSRIGFNINFLAISLLLFWATPYLISLLILASTSKEITNNQKSIPFLVWIFSILFLVLFLISRGDYTRYGMNIIPAIAILGGLYLSKIKWTRNKIYLFSTTSFIYLIFTYFINFLPRDMTPRIISEYLSQISLANFFFLFSYTSSSGPTFGITFFSFFITLIISTILLLIYFYVKTKNKIIGRNILITLIAINFAFNLFLITELVLTPTSPDISESINEMEIYFKENNLPFPIFSNNAGTLFMLDNQNEISNKSFGLADFELNSKNDGPIKILSEHEQATAIILNWPPLPEYSPIWGFLNHCQKTHTFYSKDYETGWIYSC